MLKLIRMRGGNSDITILPNVNTLQRILNVVGAKLKVSFDISNSLASVIGFNRSIYGIGRLPSEQLECKLHSGALQHYSLFIHAWCASPGCLQFLPKCRSWAEDTRITTQFNISPGNRRRHFNSVRVANRSTRKGTGSTWRGIDYTFSYS